MHRRYEIREFVRVVLSGVSGIPPERIMPGRTRPLEAAHAPTLLIYTSEEVAGNPMTGHPAALGRDLQLFIDVRVSTADVPDDDLDAIADAVETRMRVDRALGGLAFDSRYAGAQIDVRAEGDRHAGSCRLEYRVRYARDGEDED